ncbi:precorrin-6A/cobalt-precorrin-6A reductase [Prochlorococcus sp. MIT 1223]|uniref:precorrin-6A/cobalt-precorrin-6A reductase n=1 Tax=Prochlorococcus sp. MIT 1223 TaxID=3096217 RepID=UPI002A74FEC4|nr:precorrin-6A/cobalt-precorrin-6A reductase [Prochlorococcus sp. MIT 1223]
MQIRRNCQRHIWLLSGTGEGPYIARALIKYGWKVTVSVVSSQAAEPYIDFSLEELKVGPLDGVKGIKEFLEEAEKHSGFDWVLDATHPFALNISNNLHHACKEFNQALLRYVRPLEDCSGATLIHSSKELSHLDMKGQNILIALGARYLKEAVQSAKAAGAIVYARIFPTPESLQSALNCNIEPDNLAVVRPQNGELIGDFEMAICRRWSINGIVCRQSGGKTEKLWIEISRRRKLKLWLISRPFYPDKVETIHSLNKLLLRID